MNIQTVSNSQVVNDDETLESTDVLIEDGKITKVCADIVAESDCKVIDAAGKVVLPGGIDPSVRLHNRKSDDIRYALLF